MIVKATANGLRISSRKMGLIASLVRNRTVADAEVILDHTPKKGAKQLKKLLMSAKANALNNHSAKEATLAIANIDVGPGPSMKRYRPAARGRAITFKRHSSNVTISLEAEKKQSKPKAKAKAKKETK